MSGDNFYLTPEGAEKIRQELEDLRGPQREELARRLRHAVQQGDLSENADYIMAKEDQAFLEGRIMELEILLRDAVVVEKDAQSDVVEIGTLVTVIEDGYPPETFHLVGKKEVNPGEGKISYESPIGKALIGKRIGESTTADTPGGPITYTILGID
jgi:transcription elongation factor GreA